jgi:hypothetical protein
MKTKLYIIIISLSMGLNGCILDSLDKINQNLPISVYVNIEDEQVTTVDKTLPFDLNNSETYQDYKNDITKLEYTSISFRTTELNMPALEADIQVTLNYGSNSAVYTKRIKPEDYKTQPLVFELTAADIAGINEYLASPNGKVFVINVKLNNVNPSSGLLTLRGYIDAVFNFEAEL